MIDLLGRTSTGGGALVGAVKAAGVGGGGHVSAEFSGGESAVLVELEQDAGQKAEGEDEDNASGLSHGRGCVLRLGCWRNDVLAFA